MRRLFAHRQLDEELRKSEARYRTVLDTAFDAIVTITPDGIVRWFNRGAERIFGHSSKEVIGQPVTLLMPERYRELCMGGLHRYLRTGEARVVGGTTELVGLRKDGSEFPIEMSLGETYEDGERMFTGVIRDVTERKRAESALRESEQRFRGSFERAATGMALVGTDGRFLRVNKSLCEILGYTERELLGKTFQETTHPDDLEVDLEHLRRLLVRVVRTYQTEKRYLHKDGHVVWTLLSVSVVHDEEDEPLYFICQIQDVSERKKVEKAIIESEERFRSLVQYSSDIITILDTDGTVHYVSPAVERVTGYRPEEQVGTNAFGSVHPDDREQALNTFAEVLKRPGLHPPLEFRVPHKDGSWRYLEHVVNNLVDDPAVRGVVVNSWDVTERKALVEQLSYQAFHDLLTGLPNRALFMNRLEHTLTRAKRRGSMVAVLFTDLDNFKVINDSLGHKAGDQLLIAVAERLKTCLRPEDTAARLGGDEFTILLEGVAGVSDAARVAERIAEELQDPFALEAQEVFATTSTGIAVSSSTQEQPTELLQHADLAMYQAKSKGKACHEVFEPSMSIDALERLELETKLRRALGREEFRVYYQPEILLASGEIVGMEALVRWEHPGRGLLLPQEFLSIAEESNLILSIGQWVLREACNQLRTWQEQYPSTAPLVIGVNLSTREFFQPSLIAEILRETGVDPQTLQLEITEGAVAYNHAQNANNTLWGLKALGVQLAIDDFGMGYSSLSYLKQFPVNVLKIDRSFVRELGKDPKDTKIVAAIIHLARALDLRVIAEGVETAEQVEQLRKMGCDVAQGYYFSEPLPSEAVSALLQQQRS